MNIQHLILAFFIVVFMAAFICIEVMNKRTMAKAIKESNDRLSELESRIVVSLECRVTDIEADIALINEDCKDNSDFIAAHQLLKEMK